MTSSSCSRRRAAAARRWTTYPPPHSGSISNSRAAQPLITRSSTTMLTPESSADVEQVRRVVTQGEPRGGGVGALEGGPIREPRLGEAVEGKVLVALRAVQAERPRGVTLNVVADLGDAQGDRPVHVRPPCPSGVARE